MGVAFTWGVFGTISDVALIPAPLLLDEIILPRVAPHVNTFVHIFSLQFDYKAANARGLWVYSFQKILVFLFTAAKNRATGLGFLVLTA